MSWVEFVVFFLVLAFYMISFFFGKKKKPHPINDASEEPYLDEEDLIKKFFSAKELEGEQEAARKIKPDLKAIKKPVKRGRREAAHLDKSGSFHGSVEARHLQSKVEDQHIAGQIDPHERKIVSDQFQSELDKQIVSDRFNEMTEDESYVIASDKATTRLEDLVQEASSPRDMILFYEILSPPKGMQ